MGDPPSPHPNPRGWVPPYRETVSMQMPATLYTITSSHRAGSQSILCEPGLYLIPPPPGILSLHRLKRDPVYVRVILPDKSEQTIAMGASTVEQVLVLLGVNPIEVIVSRNGRLVPDDAQVSGDDEIRIIRIAHGG
ncbi:MAG: hypothetical protein STSR0009_04760 [Methanoregula sp.]